MATEDCPLCGKEVADLAGHVLVCHPKIAERRPAFANERQVRCLCGRFFNDDAMLADHWAYKGGLGAHILVETLCDEVE